MDAQDVALSNISDRQSIAERVINVHTTKSYDWVLENVFSEVKCGKRNRVLFWKADKPGSCHFFIEFASKDSVPISQREAGSGVTVHCLSRNMNMFGIFDCLTKGIEPPRKRANADAEGSQASDPPDTSRRPSTSFVLPSAKRPRIYENVPPRRTSPPPNYRDVPYKPYRQNTNFSQNPRDRSQRNPTFNNNSKPKPSWNTTLDSHRYQNDFNTKYQKTRFRNNDLQSPNGSDSPPRRPKEDVLYYGDRDDDRALGRNRDTSPHRTSHRRASDASTRRLSDASVKRPSDISMRKPSDATIPPSPDAYNPVSPRFSVSTQPPVANHFGLPELQSLSDDNVGAVIDCLKTSFSGPESWMMVAAHYRRRKLHKSALAVVDSMLEVMRDRGMEKSDLRPALLLMAQCHYSIAKQERREPDSLEASNRHFVLLLDWLRETYGPNTPALDAILQSGLRSPWNTEKENRPPFGQHPYDFSFRMPVPGYDPLQPGPSLFDTHSSVPARVDAVSEENARLRDSQSATMAELTATRAALQEAEASMRATETKLARALDDQRLTAARVQRESDARRRIEDKLVQERTQWERRSDELRDGGARAAVRELSAILEMVARAPMTMLEATRVFCEARGRLEREPPDAP